MALFSNQYYKLIFLIPFVGIFYLITGCASMQAPTGGPKDTQPPKIVKETPKNLTRNFNAKEIDIEFDEFVKLTNEFKEVTISPAVTRSPLFKIKKNILEIKLQDSLEKNTTYTINFGKAIVDYNAGNILRNYSYVFSTGNVIDSLSISGNVIETLTKKSEMDILVFIFPTRQDSIFGKKSPSIFTTTDSAGNFILRNLKPDSYRIYALKEQQGGGDRIYNSNNEEIAFLGDPIMLTKNTSGIKLELFKEKPASFSTEERKIESDGRILFKFNQQVTNPSLKILSPAGLDDRKTVEFSTKGDTALLWLPEIAFDSINVAVQSKGINIDTVTLRRNKRDTYTRLLNVNDNIGTGISPGNNLTFTFSAPITSYDAGKISLLEDSVATKNLQILKDTSSLRRYKLIYPWKTGHSYIINLLENAFTGPFGGNKFYTGRFKVNANDSYGNLILALTVPVTANYIIQVISDENGIVRSNKVTADSKIELHNIPTGKYSIRFIYDANNNGEWDTGNVKQKIQPEKIWNYPKIITVRANWDQEEIITVPGIP
jgi:hypothetical protein